MNSEKRRRRSLRRTRPETADVLLCSFCGKAKSQVSHLIAGPGVYICDECVTLSVEIIEELDTKAASDPAAEEVVAEGEAAPEAPAIPEHDRILAALGRIEEATHEFGGMVGIHLRLQAKDLDRNAEILERLDGILNALKEREPSQSPGQ